jgi:hypothetical protein
MRHEASRPGSVVRAWTLALLRCVAAAFLLSATLQAQVSSINVSAYDLPRQVAGMKVSDLLQKPPFSNADSKIELWCVWSEAGAIHRKKATDFTVSEQQALIVQRYSPGFGDREGVANPLTAANPKRSDDRKYRDATVASADKGGVVGVEIDPPVDSVMFALWAVVVAAAVGLLLGALIGAALARRARPA